MDDLKAVTKFIQWERRRMTLDRQQTLKKLRYQLLILILMMGFLFWEGKTLTVGNWLVHLIQKRFPG